jgi:hypothetical protein
VVSPSDVEAKQIASSFRPNFRPLLYTLLANFVMAVVLLGLPYARGRSIARAQRPAFAHFAQCLLGGELDPQPGLSLPDHERDHFASNVLFAPSNWPLLCRASLHELAPPDATFLWPSVKEAGVDLRAIVKLFDGELAMLHRARSLGSARVPSRPLLALAKLQAGLTLMAKATNLDADIDNYAVRFRKPARLASPARLPLMAAETATLDLWSAGGNLEAIALDGRGASWLRVDAGKIDRDRIKRTSLVRSVLRSGNEPYVVWAMPQARCQERDDRCARRATGVAAYDKGGTELPTPSWLAGHPAQRPDRALHIEPGGRVDLLALSQDGAGLEVRRFRIDQHVKPLPDAPPLQPEQTWIVPDAPAASAAVLGAGEMPFVAFAQEQAGQISARLVHVALSSPPIVLPTVNGQTPWLFACTAPHAQWVAYGSQSSRQLVFVSTDGSVTAAGAADEQIETPLHADNPALDQVKLLCDEHGARLLTRRADATLWLTVCAADGRCAPPQHLAEQVASFSALMFDATTLVALSGTGNAREIRVLHTDETGRPQGLAATPATCWDPFGGFCGVPTLTRDGERVVLGAREGSDLLAIESSDGGQHFVTLSGVQVGRALNDSAHDPLQQHRIRKGIE